MTKISLKDFKALIAIEDWCRTLEITENDPSGYKKYLPPPDDDAPVRVKTVFSGEISRVSFLEGLTITYYETYSYNAADPSSLKTGRGLAGKSWHLYGFIVLDEQGEIVDQQKLIQYLPKEFSLLDYSEIGGDEFTPILVKGADK